ncbi:hypothetical protein H0E86_26235 [Streptomyces sp. SCSIO-PteL053]|nr:hypothetical protein H0E86_26235 [Streptomyces sp. SCSIO-PteL053]
MQFSPKVIATALAAAVALGAGVVGTAHASASQTAPPAALAVKKAASAKEDGRALFGGLVFTQGRVADSLIGAATTGVRRRRSRRTAASSPWPRSAS